MAMERLGVIEATMVLFAELMTDDCLEDVVEANFAILCFGFFVTHNVFGTNNASNMLS